MPPQQISPSAASRSPCSSAMSHAFAERLGDLLRDCRRIGGPVAGARRRVDPHDAVRPDAEVASAFARSRRLSAPASESSRDPRRFPSPSRRRSAARPARRRSRRRASSRQPCRPAASRSSSDESMLTCGSKRNRSTPSNLTPSTSRRRSGRASCRDRSAVRCPGPCRRVRATWRCEWRGFCAYVSFQLPASSFQCSVKSLEIPVGATEICKLGWQLEAGAVSFIVSFSVLQRPDCPARSA